MRTHPRLALFLMAVSLSTLLAVPSVAVPPAKSPAPSEVQMRDPRHDADPSYRALAEKLRLEAGADVLPTEFLEDDEASGSRELLILRAMQEAEGGYDAVNIYDRGILSWGIMQWAAHSNSLQECLWFIKGRLQQRGKGRVWAALFKSNGLDVQLHEGEPAFFVGGPDSWKPVLGIENLRVLFRGTRVVGGYDSTTVTRWAQIFARAGRQTQVQNYQNAYAIRRVRAALAERVVDGMRVSEITRGDLFSDALYFSFWTNNPAAARRHLNVAVHHARVISGKSSPPDWPQGLFPFVWEQVGLASTFGTWPSRTRLTAKTIPAGAMGRESAHIQLASRGWSIDSVRRGERTRTAKLWTKEPPIERPSVAPRLSPVSLSALDAAAKIQSIPAATFPASMANRARPEIQPLTTPASKEKAGVNTKTVGKPGSVPAPTPSRWFTQTPSPRR